MLHPPPVRGKGESGAGHEGGCANRRPPPARMPEKSKAFCGTGGMSAQKASERGDLR